MNTDIETLRKKYMENPPEGMTSQDIRSNGSYYITHCNFR